MNVGGVFDGAGLLAYGLHLAGLEHAWLCESDEWRRGILHQRFPGVPVYPDVRAVGHGAERVDVIAGGFPCKGASTAGPRNGFDHPETVLWREMARCVGELRPRFVLVENVANLLAVRDGAVWGEVVGDLAALGYDTVWDCLPAAAVGAPHLRDRVFAIATDRESVGRYERVLPIGAASQESPAGNGRDHVVADDDGARADAHPQAGRPREAARERTRATPNADRITGRNESQPERGRSSSPAVGAAGQVAFDPDEGRRQGRTQPDCPPPIRGQQLHARPHADGLGVPVGVEWGIYEPAIRRWETLAGPAPEPLLSGMDARGARRVVRSRLSALGDGVQVQVGYLAGRHIMTLGRRSVTDYLPGAYLRRAKP